MADIETRLFHYFVALAEEQPAEHRHGVRALMRRNINREEIDRRRAA
jgi:hypothetical protein